MSAVLIKLLNMSLTASVLALVVILVKLCFKRMPRFISVLLWGLVAVRLMLPFNFESALSLLPSDEPIPQNIVSTTTPQINSSLPFIDNAVNDVLLRNFSHDNLSGDNPLQTVLALFGIVWIIGVAAMLIYAAVSWIRIKHRLREAVNIRDNVYICDHIPSPFILGIFKARIYLPSDIDKSDAECVIAHENAHIKRRDNIWKPLAFLLLSVYWFNPVLWVAYILFARDIEQATDEKVISSFGEEIKIRYSNALLNCSGERRFITACPLAFGENAVKGRVRNVLNYKKPAFWVLVAAVVVCVAVSLLFLTAKNDSGESSPFPETANEGEYFLDGIVLGIENGAMTVRNIVFVPYAEAEDGIYTVPLDSELGILPQISIGCKVRVVYDGETDDSPKPKLSNVFSVHTFGELPPEKHSPLADFKYHNNYYGGKTITEYIGSDEQIVIPTVIDGKAVTEIAGGAFESNLGLKSVYIPDTVYKIGMSAFENCMYLESVHMPIALYSIGSSAFYGCTRLKEITIPETTVQLGNECFAKCYALEFIRIPKSIAYWGNRPFYDCGLTEVVFDPGLATIGDCAFYDCIKLEKVTIPNDCEIGWNAFYGCYRLPKEYWENE